MDNYVNVVLKQGYHPYKFADLGEFNKFKTRLKSGLNDIGVSTNDFPILNLLETNIEIALKAALIYWKLNGLNQKIDAGIDETSVDNVGRIVNGSGKGLPNGYKDRRKYTRSAFDNLKK